jgi:flagellar biosynthesis component FlhA
MPEMFGGNFLITALVVFGIIMVTVRLGMFDSVVYKFGTQRSLITRAWALFLTIISLGIIVGLGLLVEAIASINLDLIMGAFADGLSDLFNSPIMPMIGIIIFVLIALYVVNKIRKKITRTVRTRKYNSSAQAKQEWERREQERQEREEKTAREWERREQERQEREEKPKQESTIDLSKYYKILGLTPGAAKEQIIARFRELTLKYHSDRGGSDDKLKEILEAKEILLNNKKK